MKWEVMDWIHLAQDRDKRWAFTNTVMNVGASQNIEWPKKMYTLFTHQYLWNKFKLNFYFRVRV